jgi:ankyrin repeat protein
MDDYGPLHLAILKGYNNIINELIKYADIHLSTFKSDTSLHIASRNGNTKVVQ